LATLEDVATAGSSTVNAAVFLERASRSRGPRRAAALILAGLFAAIGAGVAGEVAPDGPAAEVVLGAPLLAANLAVTTVLALAVRR